MSRVGRSLNYGEAPGRQPSDRVLWHAAKLAEVDFFGRCRSVPVPWLGEPGHRGVEFRDEMARLDSHSIAELHALRGVRIANQGDVVASIESGAGRGTDAPAGCRASQHEMGRASAASSSSRLVCSKDELKCL